jgi:hypothetical protein
VVVVALARDEVGGAPFEFVAEPALLLESREESDPLRCLIDAGLGKIMGDVALPTDSAIPNAKRFPFKVVVPRHSSSCICSSLLKGISLSLLFGTLFSSLSSSSDELSCRFVRSEIRDDLLVATGSAATMMCNVPLKEVPTKGFVSKK